MLISASPAPTTAFDRAAAALTAGASASTTTLDGVRGAITQLEPDTGTFVAPKVWNAWADQAKQVYNVSLAQDNAVRGALELLDAAPVSAAQKDAVDALQALSTKATATANAADASYSMVLVPAAAPDYFRPSQIVTDLLPFLDAQNAEMGRVAELLSAAK